MPFTIQECTDEDMPRAFELLSEAFGHEHPYVESVFPAHGTPEGRRIGGERMLQWRKGDPLAINVKAVDDAAGKMIGHARWIIPNGVVPPEFELGGDYWETEDQKEYAAWMFSQYLVPRRKAFKEYGGNVVSLDLMTIDPKYQRQGAGRALLKWGTNIADELGVDTIVEATAYGLGLYASEGFEVQYKWTTPMPEKWAGRETQSYWWMIRSKRVKETKN
ncbi:acyl-CoA N-acyltransferase [Lophiotrema nucula]|uniref:Acyl-CoA N-acyltransferase n=1 Tax=Lophiotrema nucula TaxID=690887 RepID=A0A6A5YX50_9PLEO|nr:acyl-CoA N-acyltransferase [Lophiotrema nucula]